MEIGNQAGVGDNEPQFRASGINEPNECRQDACASLTRRNIMKNKEQTSALSATEIILESISDGVFTVDHQWRITAFNRPAEAITGIGRAEAIGRRCSE